MANQDHVKLLLSGAENWNKNKPKHPDLSRTDLSWTNLSESDLSRSDLSWTDLSGTNLSRSDLRWTNLSRANLRWTNLSETDLRWTNLSESDLSETNLSRSDLSWTIGNGKEIISVFFGKLACVMTKDVLWVGCEQHSWKEWMDKDAIKFRDKWADILQQIRKTAFGE